MALVARSCKSVRMLQLTLFRQMARAQLLDMLMGRSDNKVVARGGNSGMAWDYFDGLVGELDLFLRLMEQVRKRRDELKPQLRVRWSDGFRPGGSWMRPLARRYSGLSNTRTCEARSAGICRRNST